MKKLDTIDHIAIQTKDIKESVAWYTRTFTCDVIFQDETWALLEFNNIKLALTDYGNIIE